MTDKLALIVDDSRTARVLLRKMLAGYNLAVDEVESAEEALDYLRHRRPDVIFMDHMMPGMDGLEAVRIIKEDPKTATIPIMMYTSKQGEVYVGQARALGALGILPKEVEPAELFQVLRSLNLVTDRRSEPAPPPPESIPILPSETLQEVARVAAASVAADTGAGQIEIERLIDRQRELIRAEVSDACKAAVDEALRELQDDAGVLALPGLRPAADSRPRRPAIGMLMLFALLALPLAWFYSQYQETRVALQQARAHNTSLQAVSTETRSHILEQRSSVVESLEGQIGQLADWNQALLEALEWAVNLDSGFDYGEPALGDRRAEILQGLLTRLNRAGFQGTVLLEVQFGDFCQVRDQYGQLQLAPDDLPIDACDFVGPVTTASAGLVDQQSLAFGRFLDGSPLVGESGIEVELAAAEPPPGRFVRTSQGTTAGEWNRAARHHNRVRVSLIPAPAGN